MKAAENWQLILMLRRLEKETDDTTLMFLSSNPLCSIFYADMLEPVYWGGGGWWVPRDGDVPILSI